MTDFDFTGDFKVTEEQLREWAKIEEESGCDIGAGYGYRKSMESDAETGLIVLCAIRYAIGRRTYMPSTVVSWVKRHWRAIAPKDRALILRDVTEACDRHSIGGDYLGDACDVATWMEFKQWMEGR